MRVDTWGTTPGGPEGRQKRQWACAVPEEWDGPDVSACSPQQGELKDLTQKVELLEKFQDNCLAILESKGLNPGKNCLQRSQCMRPFLSDSGLCVSWPGQGWGCLAKPWRFQGAPLWSLVMITLPAQECFRCCVERVISFLPEHFMPFFWCWQVWSCK